MKPLKALVSVHDVMPSTLPQVEAILERLNQQNITPITLLVVPGLAWRQQELETLRRWQAQGCQLAGHGWVHHAAHIRGLRHWLHSGLISRNVAEHLALDEEGIADLIQRCFDWFTQHDLNKPTLYVPPAWAMGAIKKSRLNQLPFRYFETMSGVYDGATGTSKRLPLVGYEADTTLRVDTLRLWNYFNTAIAKRGHLLRIGIHPQDFELRLAGDLEKVIARPLECFGYGSNE